MVRLISFGPFKASGAEGRTFGFETVKAAQILARLVASRHQTVTRQELCASLWPDSDDHRARSSLRSALSSLRRTFGNETIFGCDSTELWLVDGAVSADLWEAEALYSRCIRAQGYALADVLSDFIDLVEPSFCPAWANEWADELRSFWQERWSGAASRLVSIKLLDEDWPAALDLCHRLLKEDPYSEFAAGVAVRCLANMGDRASAIRLIDQTVALWRAELGCEPSAHFMDIGVVVRRGVNEPPQAAPIMGTRILAQVIEDAIHTDPGGALALMRSVGLRPSSYVDPPATLDLLEKVLSATTGASPDRLKVAYGAAVFSGFLNLHERCNELCDFLLDEADGDPLTTSRALMLKGFNAFETRNWDAAVSFTLRAQEMAAGAGLDRMVNDTAANLASFAWHQLRLDEARKSYTGLLEKYDPATFLDAMQIATIKCNLGHLELAAGNWEAAFDALDQSLSWTRANHDRRIQTYGSTAMGYALVRLGRPDEAVDHLQNGLLMAHESHIVRFRDIALEHIGMSLVSLGVQDGVWVIDAAERAREHSGHLRSPAESSAVEEALGLLPPHVPRQSQPPGPADDMSPSELVERAFLAARLVLRRDD